MKLPKARSRIPAKYAGKMFRHICRCTTMLICVLLMVFISHIIAPSYWEVDALTQTGGTLSPISPLPQQIKLTQPSSVMPGGKGFMLPQVIVVKDSFGNPVSGVAVNFEVSTDNLITAVMRGSNSKSITVITDSNGVASASNTYPGYEGEGFQVYSKYTGIVKTLQVKASILGADIVTFNVEIGTYGSNIVDNTPPTITASAKDETGANYVAGTWTKHSVTVHYDAADTLSGIKSCSPDQVFTSEGANQFATGIAVDNAVTSDSDINHISTVTFGPINIDKSAPITTATATPSTGDVWVKGMVEIRFNATDSVSEVESIYYRLGNNEPIKASGSSTTINISLDGITNVSYWAVDRAGNVEAAKSITVKVDQNAPTMTYTLSPEKNPNGWNNSDVTVTLTAADTSSGVKEIRYKIGELGVEQLVQGQSTTFMVNSEGIVPVTFWAVDNVGNISAAQRIDIKIDKTAPIVSAPADMTVEATAINTPVAIGTATVYDTSPDVTLTNDAPAGGFPIGITKVTWTARDQVGNISSAVQTITVRDTIKPVLTAPSDIVVEATAVRTRITLQTPVATDIFPVVVTSNAPIDFPLGITAVTWTATDANNNSVFAIQYVTVVDSTKPVLQFPANITIEATGVRTAVSIGTASATDIFKVNINNNAPLDYPVGTTKVLWEAADENGNVSKGEQIITVVDTIKPALNIPADKTVEATAIRTPVAIGQAVATDIFKVTITNDAPADFPVGTTIVTWKATDENNNMTTAQQKVTITDTTKPVLTIPADITLEATAVNTPVSIGEATATDIFKVTITKNSMTAYPVGITVVTWTATDENGNISTGQQVITVVDTTKPVLSIPSDMTIEATAVKTPVYIGQATATDVFRVNITNNAPGIYPIGITTVTWIATDENGNVSTLQQNITVKDTTKPVITVPANITVEATAVRTQVQIGTATAIDIFPVTLTNNAPLDYPIGTTTVTWTAKDENGNTSLGYQEITVVDKTVPLITIPTDITVEATTVRTPVTIGTATATDIFPVTVVNDAPLDYPLGTTNVTWTATDSNGNTSVKVQNITVTDTTKPVLIIPADITVEATAINTPITIGMATATDIFSVTITNNAPANYPLGKTVVIWRATDANGNVSEKSQAITVTDKTPPAFKLPENLTIEASAVKTPLSLVPPIATDIFGILSLVNNAPAEFPLGTTIVKWTATDVNGNIATCEQIITIVDATKPLLSVPMNITKEATGVNTTVDIGNATATDIFNVTISNNAPVDYPIGTTIVKWAAIDANGNEVTKEQIITIIDTTKPVLMVPSNKTVEATALRTPVAIGNATATDIFNVTITNNAPADYPIGITIVKWTATDANGNAATGEQIITIIDTTKPVLMVPANKTVEATAARTPVAIGNATATDIFNVTITNNAPVDYPIGTTIVKWTATDANGNATTGEQIITIVDTTKPVLSLPANKTVEATGIKTAVDIGLATATDIFNVTVTSNASALYSIGTTIVTWTAIDANNNVNTGEQIITIVDTTKPVLTVPGSRIVEATAVKTPVDIGTATATDIFAITITNNAPIDYPIGTTIVTWKAIDANGNETTKEQSITIVDTTKPVLSVPTNKIVEATGVRTPVSIGMAAATDIFNAMVSNNAPADYPIGTTIVVWTAKDANGNETTAEQIITIADTTKPVLSVPDNKTVEATGIKTPVSIETATATDIFDVTITNNAPADYSIGTTIVKWTAKDANGNEITKEQSITIVDTTKPVLSVPANKTVEATGIKTPVAIGTATATDIFNVTITNNAPIDYPIGTTIITWKAIDANGNETTKEQSITIVDTTKPLLSVPLSITKEATAIKTPVDIGVATATDIFGVTITNNASADYPIGTTIVKWTAKDANGNEITKEQSITIVDTTKPVLSVPANKTVEATGVRTPVDIGMATASDIFGVTITNNVPVDYPIGTTIVKWTAKDASGNDTMGEQIITIVDTTKPVLSVPADITKEATAIRTPADIGMAASTDIFGVTITNNAPVDYPIGTTIVVWTAKDANGNETTKEQIITIVDTTTPVLSVPADITKEATAIRTPADIGVATAVDIFGITITNNAPSDYPIGTTIVTWTATDTNGNSITKEQTITIVDTTKPLLSIPLNITKEATAIRTPVDIGMATAADIFGVTITNNAPVDYSIGATIVVWTATDANGNKTTKEQTITIVDTTKPVLSVPSNKTKEATGIRTPVSIGVATTTDIFEVTITNNAPVDYPIGTTIVTWKAIDANGNETTGEQIITIVDTTKPLLSVPADITKEATAIRTPVDIGVATVTDIFGVTITNNAPSDYPIGTTIVTWTATDANGNASTGEQIITIVDTTRPIIVIPADKIVEATAVRTPVNIGVATATDIYNVTITNNAPVDYSIGTTIVTWTATDANGNSITKEQTITIVDTTKPLLSIPLNITKEATAIKTPVSIGMATATDIFEVTITNNSPVDYPMGTTIVVWTATDANGNITTKEQTITIVDTTKPLLSVPSNKTKEATAIKTPVSIGMATATDIFEVTITNNAPVDYPIGTTIVTWTATDANGNTTKVEQIITIVDTTKPLLSVPSNKTKEATGIRTPVSIGVATATDIFEVTITNNAPVDYPIGTTIVTWKAIDANGNETTGEQIITIVDTTKPVLSVPADITKEATAIRTPVSIGVATATDIFGVTITNNAPVDYPIGTTIVTWTATDANGNITTGEQIITIVDITKPVLVIPADKIVEATAVRTPVNIGVATATDIFDVMITNDAPVDYSIGITIVTWTATDANGNIATAQQSITIVDTTKPVLIVPANMTVEATAIRTPVNIGLATATDIFDVMITNDAPVDYPIGTTIVTWTVTDVNGNKTTREQIVTIVDTTKPTLNIPANKTVEAIAVRTPIDIGVATATDIFGATIINDAPTDYPVGTTIIVWTATDANGNVTTKQQLITIVDTTKPLLLVPGNKTVEATAVKTPVEIGQATGTDIFGVTITNDAPTDYPIGITIVKWTATDANGNATIGEQSITIVDTTKPVLIVPANMTVEATGVKTPVSIGMATAVDIFDVAITNDAPADYPIGDTIVKWTAVDANGNVSTGEQIITIVDRTNPTLTVPGDKIIEATGIRTPVNIGVATATDITDVVITNDAPVDYPIGTTIVTWTAIDANGNALTEKQKITIIDTTKPILKVPADITVPATGVKTQVYIGKATATDIFPITVTNDAPADYPVGITAVTWTAIDLNGNVSTAVQYITVIDKLRLKAYNSTKNETTNSIDPWILIENVSQNTIDIKNITVRYYYTVDGAANQSYRCDNAQVYTNPGNRTITSYVKGVFGETVNVTGSDYYLEISFTNSAGKLKPGEKVLIQSKFTKNNGGTYIQTNDYSFNTSATDYVDTNKITIYISGVLVSGVEP